VHINHIQTKLQRSKLKEVESNETYPKSNQMEFNQTALNKTTGLHNNELRKGKNSNRK
jgi:hypothetical protein